MQYRMLFLILFNFIVCPIIIIVNSAHQGIENTKKVSIKISIILSAFYIYLGSLEICIYIMIFNLRRFIMNKFLSCFLIIVLFQAGIIAFIFHNKDSAAKVANASTVACANMNSSSSVSANNFTIKNIKTGILGVKDVTTDPNAHKGTIIINGVTTGVGNDGDKVFAIADTTNVITYKRIDDETPYLLVKYNGKLPQEGYEVNITGSLAGSGDNIVFNATEIKTIRSVLPKGGQ